MAEKNKDSDARAQMNEPVALIGMACRFPGGVNNPDEFWSLLCNGIDAITEVPRNRWDNTAWYGAGAGKICTQYGGFLNQIDQFDAPFFHITPPKANTLDPQQRLLLETHWEALEHAGINPQSVRGSNTSIMPVFLPMIISSCRRKKPYRYHPTLVSAR